MSRYLIWLTLGAFAIGTEGFMIAGILPLIAGDLSISIPLAGQLVTDSDSLMKRKQRGVARAKEGREKEDGKQRKEKWEMGSPRPRDRQRCSTAATTVPRCSVGRLVMALILSKGVHEWFIQDTGVGLKLLTFV